MKKIRWIGFLVLMALVACNTPTREARRMVRRAERLANTFPDSTVRLIDSVLSMPVYFNEKERMEMALLQAEALFGYRDVSRNVSENNDTGMLVYGSMVNTDVQQILIIPITNAASGNYSVELSNATGSADGDFEHN